MVPKAKLVLIGGAEDKGEGRVIEPHGEVTRYEILSELLPFAPKKIEIITTGSAFQEEVKRVYQNVFHHMGYEHIGFIPIRKREEARQREYLKRVETSGAFFLTGGDQNRLVTILRDTPLMDIIKERYINDSDFIIAGTSAGAMVMASFMITGAQQVSEALRYRHLLTSSGFGILPSCIIDTHFIKRGRFSRLAHAIIMHPQQLGIGLGEDTALVIRHGVDAECYGSGMVVILDGHKIKHSNRTEVKEGDALFADNLIVHLLVKGYQFSITDRSLAIPVNKA